MAADKIIIKFQEYFTELGPSIEPERDSKINIALRPYLSYVRDEIDLARKAFIIVRRAALKKLIETDYNKYVKELRKYDSAIIPTQP